MVTGLTKFRPQILLYGFSEPTIPVLLDLSYFGFRHIRVFITMGLLIPSHYGSVGSAQLSQGFPTRPAWQHPKLQFYRSNIVI
ncbi:hypothetical protein FKM82_030637 [Ascaphus truei]